MVGRRAVIAALALAHTGPYLGENTAHSQVPPPNGYKSNNPTSRTHTAQDDKAKAKKVAKRRAKKGYR